MPQLQFFLSAVSDDFRSQRDEIRSRLQRTDLVTAKTQEEFGPSGHATLGMLEAYVKGCDAVIHLVGDHAGSRPVETSVRELLQRYPQLWLLAGLASLGLAAWLDAVRFVARGLVGSGLGLSMDDTVRLVDGAITSLEAVGLIVVSLTVVGKVATHDTR